MAWRGMQFQAPRSTVDTGSPFGVWPPLFGVLENQIHQASLPSNTFWSSFQAVGLWSRRVHACNLLCLPYTRPYLRPPP